MTKTINALGGETVFGYDPNGNLLTVKDARNNTTTYVYDALSNLRKVTLPNGDFADACSDDPDARCPWTRGDYYEITAQLGGPIVKDKLWFFASAHNPKTSRIAPNIYGFQPGSRDFSGWNTLAKLTFTPFSNHTFAGRHTNSYATITNILFSSAAENLPDCATRRGCAHGSSRWRASAPGPRSPPGTHQSVVVQTWKPTSLR